MSRRGGRRRMVVTFRNREQLETAVIVEAWTRQDAILRACTEYERRTGRTVGDAFLTVVTVEPAAPGA